MSATPQPISRHAVCRSRSRQIPLPVIDAVLTYGRCRNARGAEVYTLGWREVRRWAEHGLDLSRIAGVEVVCSFDGLVITVYRNRKPGQTRDRAPQSASRAASRHRAREVLRRRCEQTCRR